MLKRLNIGLVGTSDYTQFVNLPVLSKHENVNIIAICGRNRTRAEEVAAQFGIPQVFTDYEQMFALPGLDAVIIAAPDDLHYPMTMAALRAGLHVMGEKPMALNAQQAKEMLAAAEQAGVKHMIMFAWRFFPHYQYMQQLIADGYVGRSYHCHIRFLSNAGRKKDYSWDFDPNRSIGALGAIGSHMIHLAHFFQGDIRRVSAQLGSFVVRETLDGQHAPGANDTALLMVEYANGAQGMIHVSMIAHTANRGREQVVSLHGELGTLELDWKVFGPEAQVTLRGARHDEAQFQIMPIPEEYLKGVASGAILPVFEQHLVGPRLFVDAILNDYLPTPNFYDGYKVQQVIDAAIKSHATGCWVDVG